MPKLNTSPNTRWLLFIILFAAILILSALFITTTQLSPSLSTFIQKEKGVSLKNVYSSIPSSDGKSHTFAADFYITSSKEDIEETKSDQLQMAILKIIPTLNYDLITEKNGTDYLVNTIEKKLKTDPANQWVDQIYVSSLLLDVEINHSQDNEDSNSTLKEMFSTY